MARVNSLPPGRFEVSHDRTVGLGFLMLDGLLARDVVLVGSTSTELLGAGDVIHAAVAPDDGLVRHRVLWHVLAPTRLAVLDDAFARNLADWPQVMGVLLERTVRATLRASIHRALLQLSPVETRLLVLFWHLAERWGRVTPDGISVRLRMSHELLGQLVGCRRASVTTALHRIDDSGLVLRRSDGTWLLRGSPPDEFAELHWSRAVASGAAASR